MPITTNLDQFRLLIGDVDSAAPLFNDDEAQWFIDERNGVVRLAAADACDSLAIRFARDYDIGADGQSLARSQQSAMYAARGKQLRERASGLTVVPTTRVDGYSEDVSNREGAGQNRRTGRVRAGYWDPDLPA